MFAEFLTLPRTPSRYPTRDPLSVRGIQNPSRSRKKIDLFFDDTRKSTPATPSGGGMFAEFLTLPRRLFTPFPGTRPTGPPGHSS